jgi:hypothetical protein
MNEFVIKPKNQIFYTACIDLALAHGVPVYIGTIEDKATDFPDYPILKFDGTNITGTKSGGGYTELSLDEFEEFCKSYNGVQLNEQYTAKIDRERGAVIVGCQEIPFEKVLRLAELINK